MIETEAIEDFLSFHVYGCILLNHGKTAADFSTSTRFISQWVEFPACYKGDSKDIFPSIPTVKCAMRIFMDKNFTDSAAISIPPPIFFFVCLGCSFLLEYLFPISLINISPAPRVIVGGIFMMIAIWFAAGGFFMLIRNKTTFDTSKSTRKIVTNGVYRFSRNPLYFSLLLLLFGFAILLSSLWLFLAIPILYVLFLFKAVKPEEKYLLQKFGEEYLHYSEKVRRWI